MLLTNRMSNNGWAKRDESALRVQYSVKYTFYGCPAGPRQEIHDDRNGFDLSKSEVFLGFTGQFDFYWFTRDSDPVINRISNPGLFVRIPAFSWAPYTAMTFGLEHRSDGQTFEATKVTDEVNGPAMAQKAYDAKDRYFFDTISRGSNFVSFHASSEQALGDGYRLDYAATVRAYFTQDTDITWGPQKGMGRSISAYDRVLTRVALRTPAFGYWEVAWRLGDKGLRTDSVTLSWQAPKGYFPLYVRVHRGPMNTLSNYTQRQDSIGVGLRFTGI